MSKDHPIHYEDTLPAERPSVFDYHPYTEAQRETVQLLALKLKGIEQLLIDTLPFGAPRSRAIEKLQEAYYWAQRSITGRA